MDVAVLQNLPQRTFQKTSCEVLKLSFALATADFGCPRLSRDRICAAYRSDPGRAPSDPGRAQSDPGQAPSDPDEPGPIQDEPGPDQELSQVRAKKFNRPDPAGLIENRFRPEKHPVRSRTSPGPIENFRRSEK